MIITPTSANIASHILAIPTAPNTRQISLIPMANQMFSYTMRRHFLEIRMALAIFSGSSSIRTISAASMAASDPMAPMAIPISARESTGASLMPSPTNASFPFPVFFFSSSSTSDTLSAGRSSACTSSMPRSSATCSATFLESPVSMTVFSTPAFFRAMTASFAWGFSISEITICPA